ncbi:hypothetical protein [Curvivirga aplysinae]|uniref:hypothetical protein n=1 Tax=Curvivirga aplysinae TaxID=2529852 RepID=UPI0012BCE0A1|nr:hypothetical protein [Curvivirga aplysinae]MTI10188.1 hypothetical protein [Curvivirga aplysinae]
MAEEEPIWVQKEAICVHIHPEYQEEWGGKMATFLPPFTKQNIDTFKFIIETNEGYLRHCRNDAT